MATTLTSNRRQRSPSAEEELELPADYKPYVPVAKRRAQLLSQLTGAKQAQQVKRVKTVIEDIKDVDFEETEKQEAEAEAVEEKLRDKARRERTLLHEAQDVKKKKAAEGV
jgi:ATP-dependent RNA helicase DDX41